MGYRGGRRKGDYEPDHPTDYAYCARLIVKAAEMQATELAQARACWSAAVDAYRRGMRLQAEIHIHNRHARLLLALACASEKRKWRRIYALALANSEALLQQRGPPGAKPGNL